MNDISKKLNIVANQVNLTAQEKAQIKGALVRHMHTAKKPVVSPFFTFTYFSHYKLQSLSVFLVALIITTGLSGAAEYSLPGEALYQVKSVNENIRGLFAFTPQSKAQLHVELAVRRLEEAEQLAVAGKLQNGAKIEVETKLDQHLAAIKDNLLVLEQQNPEKISVATTTEIEGATITETLALSATTTENASTTDETPVALMMVAKMAPAVSSTTELARDIAEVSTFAVTEPVIATTTIEQKLKDASATLKEGGLQVDAQEYTKAFATVEQVEQKAKEIKSILNELPVVEEAPIVPEEQATTTDVVSTSTIATTTDSNISTSTSSTTVSTE